MEQHSTRPSSACPACGAPIERNASACGNCGESVLGPSGSAGDAPTSKVPVGRDRTSSSPRGVTTQQSYKQAAGTADTSLSAQPDNSGDITLYGTVNRFQSRQSGDSFDVWTFNLDGAGADPDRTSVLVQLGPSRMVGTLHNGESLRVTGKFREGVFHARRIFSKTHRAFVGRRETGPIGWIIGIPILLVVAIPLIVAVIAMAGGLFAFSSGRPSAMGSGGGALLQDYKNEAERLRAESERRRNEMMRAQEEARRRQEERSRAFEGEMRERSRAGTPTR